MAVAADVTTTTEVTASGSSLSCYSAAVITTGEITAVDADATASSGLSYSYAAAATAAETTTS